jgi:hypothetical protein
MRVVTPVTARTYSRTSVARRAVATSWTHTTAILAVTDWSRPMDDIEREATARRWLADNLAWSRRLGEYRDPNRWTRVVVALSALDRYDQEHPVRRDRVA